MEFSKYSATDGVTIGSVTSISQNNTSSSSSDSGGSRASFDNLDRNLWGNADDGGDITETIFVDGSIYLGGNATYDDENEDDDDKESVNRQYELEDDDEGGNVYASGKVKADKTEANETYGKQLFFNYPTVSDAKTDVAPLIKNQADTLANHETRITNNTTNIANLTTLVSTNTTNISNLQTLVNTNTTNIANLTTTVNNNTTNIANNTTEINNIKNQITNNNTSVSADLSGLEARVSTNETNIASHTTTLSDHEQRITALENADMSELYNLVKYGDWNHPIVLYTGKIRRSTVSGSNYYFVDGNHHQDIYISSTEPVEGLMTLSITAYNGSTICISSVVVNQWESGDMVDNPETTYYKGRSDGAHWFAALLDNTYGTTKVYLREMHLGNGDNDTWYSSAWCDDGGIKSVNVAMFGYVIPASTYSLRRSLEQYDSQYEQTLTDEEREALYKSRNQ